MEYNGYSASIEFDDGEGIFHGRVEGVRDTVTFEGTTVKGIRKSFKDSVDDYLAFCRERGEEPEKPFSGSFVVRVTPELHRQIYHAAAQQGKSMNAWVIERLRKTVPEN